MSEQNLIAVLAFLIAGLGLVIGWLVIVIFGKNEEIADLNATLFQIQQLLSLPRQQQFSAEIRSAFNRSRVYASDQDDYAGGNRSAISFRQVLGFLLLLLIAYIVITGGR